MGSYIFGKIEICSWIRNHFPAEAEILDVGACEGNWAHRLGGDFDNIDAVEAWAPNLENLKGLYRDVYYCDIREFEYDWYDLIIFGDIIEHLPVEDAQKVLEYAKPRCKDMIIAVPFLYNQGAIYGNPYEVHVQNDLTAENFEERYPGFEVLLNARYDYRYYHKPGVWDS